MLGELCCCKGSAGSAVSTFWNCWMSELTRSLMLTEPIDARFARDINHILSGDGKIVNIATGRPGPCG